MIKDRLQKVISKNSNALILLSVSLSLSPSERGKFLGYVKQVMRKHKVDPKKSRHFQLLKTEAFKDASDDLLDILMSKHGVSVKNADEGEMVEILTDDMQMSLKDIFQDKYNQGIYYFFISIPPRQIHSGVTLSFFLSGRKDARKLQRIAEEKEDGEEMKEMQEGNKAQKKKPKNGKMPLHPNHTNSPRPHIYVHLPPLPSNVQFISEEGTQEACPG